MLLEVTTINNDGKEELMLIGVAHITSIYPSRRPAPRHATLCCIEVAGWETPVCIKESYEDVRRALGYSKAFGSPAGRGLDE